MADVTFAEELVRNAPGLTAEELVSGRVYIKKDSKKIVKEPIKEKKPLPTKSTKGLNKAIKKLIQRANISRIPKATIRPAQQIITREQQMLQELFGGGERTFGTGQNLPKVEGILRRGKGLINNDDYGETGQMFGMRR